MDLNQVTKLDLLRALRYLQDCSQGGMEEAWSRSDPFTADRARELHVEAQKAERDMIGAWEAEVWQEVMIIPEFVPTWFPLKAQRWVAAKWDEERLICLQCSA